MNWPIVSRLRALAPGIITAALVFGPSKITITTELGAGYGFSLLWVIVVAIFFMALFTSMSARIGIAADRSLLTLIREKWGPAASLASGIGIFLVSAAFQAGNSIGIGIALSELTGTPRIPWIVFFTVAGIGLLFFRQLYRLLERLMLALILVMLLSFVTTMLLSRPAPLQIAGGLRPSLPPGAATLVIAFIASCFSIAGAFYQSYLVQERKRQNPGLALTDKSYPGIFILGVLSAVLLICSATLLHPAHMRIDSAADMAKALRPLLGRYAATLFLCGLASASFSAFIGNASLGGNLLSDALGHGGSLGTGYSRSFTALVMVIGASVAILFGRLPLQLIVFAQSITILIVPFIGTALYLIANDRRVMGALVNTTVARWAGAAGLAMLFGLALKNIKDLFF
ncbi:MAG: Nramp family divalent metal transporter [Bacteroidetes bacterium]|nr:Nramp family divalent metal transporter [Bacteroidota bacterium]